MAIDFMFHTVNFGNGFKGQSTGIRASLGVLMEHLQEAMGFYMCLPPKKGGSYGFLSIS